MFSKSELIKGIKLDSHNIMIAWNINRNDFLDKVAALIVSTAIDHNFNYYGYTILSKIFDSEKNFNLTFNYVNDKLTSINISDSTDGMQPIKHYELVQCFLETKLGKPSLFLKGNERFNLWKIKNIKIIHSIINRFGFQELLEIKNKW